MIIFYFIGETRVLEGVLRDYGGGGGGRRHSSRGGEGGMVRRTMIDRHDGPRMRYNFQIQYNKINQ